MSEILRVGIAGLGTVGAAVARLLAPPSRGADGPHRTADRRGGRFGSRRREGA